jgi:ferritin
MDTNRLSDTLAAALNLQITKEAYASQVYLSYAAWADSQGLSGVAGFLFHQANGERDHMMKMLAYVIERGAEVLIAAIPAPPENPVSINNCFERIFQHEKDNTNAVYKLVKMSLDEEDWGTWNFIQWFVKQQIIEETFAMNLLDKMKIVGGEDMDKDAVYALDMDLGKKNNEAKPAMNATTANP